MSIKRKKNTKWEQYLLIERERARVKEREKEQQQYYYIYVYDMWPPQQANCIFINIQTLKSPKKAYFYCYHIKSISSFCLLSKHLQSTYMYLLTTFIFDL